MKQYTTIEQTSKLIELGFEKPKGLADAEPSSGKWVRPAYSIGELRWRPIIDIETGQIMNWREGTTAEIHYKACDEFACTIMDNLSGDTIDDYEGYVPYFMCPKDSGYGDYIIMDIDENGYIQDWDKAAVLNFIENNEEE